MDIKPVTDKPIIVIHHTRATGEWRWAVVRVEPGEDLYDAYWIDSFCDRKTALEFCKDRRSSVAAVVDDRSRQREP